MQVDDNSGSTSWTYTSQGRVASRTQSMGVSKTVGYGYNSAGQLDTLTTPSGQLLAYSYANNRITGITLNGVTTILDDVTYDPFGPVRGWTWGNSTQTTRSYDADGNVTDIDSAGLAQYAYDDAFRITGITDTVDSNLSWSYGYDTLDRLTAASSTGLSRTWTYDANGNRLTQGGTASSTFSIASTNNRLTGVSGALSRTYSYDAAGHTTGDGTNTFGYSGAGRLTSVSGATSASYAYNGLGQRVKKTVGGTSTYFAYDESGHLVGEYDGAGDLLQEIVWLEDIPVASIRPDGLGGVGIFYIHTDQLNTPRKLTRPSDNAIVWRLDSDPFGVGTPDQDPDGNSLSVVFNLRFPGQYFDAETGTSYNYFRDYDPVTGRYVQSDPIGLDGGLNTYLYASGSPAMFADPTGESPAALALPAIAVPTAPGAGLAGGAGALGAGGAAAAGAVAGAGAVGVGIGLGINKGIDRIFGRPLGVLVYEVCRDKNESNRCDKEWEDAFRACREYFRKPGAPRGVTGGYSNLHDCARGLVSEACGGNAIDYGKKGVGNRRRLP